MFKPFLERTQQGKERHIPKDIRLMEVIGEIDM